MSIFKKYRKIMHSDKVQSPGYQSYIMQGGEIKLICISEYYCMN